MRCSNLDILIYAHDGRGLGHVSRSLSIGMALRRLYPELRILFVSGCGFTKELLGGAPLDWLKLPSYKSEVVDGKSRGVKGDSMFSDEELGAIRSKQLKDIVDLYKPQLVLADHTPQGKHKELLPSFELRKSVETGWILGVRGVVGAVKQVKSKLSKDIFQKHYSSLFWYGDSNVLGYEHSSQLASHYGVQPIECGYVSRLSELVHWNPDIVPGSPAEKKYAGTISIPWLGEHTIAFMGQLAQALAGVSESNGLWRIFVSAEKSETGSSGWEVLQQLECLESVEVLPPSGEYVYTLMQSKCALIYGGYNSLMDLLFAEIPGVVVLREMEDAEQQIHLRKLQSVLGDRLVAVSESDVSSEDLRELLLESLHTKKQEDDITADPINTNGATQVAAHLYNLLVDP